MLVEWNSYYFISFIKKGLVLLSQFSIFGHDFIRIPVADPGGGGVKKRKKKREVGKEGKSVNLSNINI